MSSETNYHNIPEPPSSVLREDHIEDAFIRKLVGLKYTLLAKPNSRLKKYRLTAQGRA